MKQIVKLLEPNGYESVFFLVWMDPEAMEEPIPREEAVSPSLEEEEPIAREEEPTETSPTALEVDGGRVDEEEPMGLFAAIRAKNKERVLELLLECVAKILDIPPAEGEMARELFAAILLRQSC